MTTESGTFFGTEVRSGAGGGLASGPLVSGGVTTHFHAARLPELGDTVLAVTRVFDASTNAALRIELRAFAAAAPGRGTLAGLDARSFADAPGALAFASVELATSGDAADERRPATLTRCVVTDAAPTATAARGVADWLRSTWEVELAFGSWPAVRGRLDAFSLDGTDPAVWAAEWLEASEHLIEPGEHEHDGPRFLKVLSAAWIELDAAASAVADAATTDD